MPSSRYGASAEEVAGLAQACRHHMCLAFALIGDQGNCHLATFTSELTAMVSSPATDFELQTSG